MYSLTSLFSSKPNLTEIKIDAGSRMDGSILPGLSNGNAYFLADAIFYSGELHKAVVQIVDKNNKPNMVINFQPVSPENYEKLVTELKAKNVFPQVKEMHPVARAPKSSYPTLLRNGPND